MFRLWEKYKAWRRGEKMIPAAVSTRGRIFTRTEVEETPAAGSPIVVRAKPTLKLVKIKVTRADGTVEEIDTNG